MASLEHRVKNVSLDLAVIDSADSGVRELLSSSSDMINPQDVQEIALRQRRETASVARPINLHSHRCYPDLSNNDHYWCLISTVPD